MTISGIRRSVAIALSLFILASTPGYAQDASQVLAISVSYRTLKNTTELTPDQRQELSSLEAKARAASQNRRYGEAMEHYLHGMALLRGQAWTPSRALTSAIQLKADRVIYDAREPIRVQVTQTFAIDPSVSGNLQARLSV